MGGFFTRERFGRPQFLAGLLLLVFLLQCGWLVRRGAHRSPMDGNEISRLQAGLRLWGRKDDGLNPGPEPSSEVGTGAAALSAATPGDDANHSRMWYLIASAALAAWPRSLQAEVMPYLTWLAAAPFLVFGVLLGASVWYVARRLYGNAGGYIALTLYCFAPGMIRASSLWFAEPETGAAWGSFGAIFTAIAVAHTLYAPREVVLWNWRRIALLGLSLALAVGSQFSLLIVIPIALIFMLYLAPSRRSAALVIWMAAVVLASLWLLAVYSFHPAALWEAMRQANFFHFTWRAMGMSGAYRQVLAQVEQSSPALALAVPAAVVTYAVWRRSRYFGNTAPLAVAALFLLLGLVTPHYPGLGFQLAALPFLFVFVAGIFADLLETQQRQLVMACLWGLLGANALWSLMELARVA